MSPHEINTLRTIDLESVLKAAGAIQDKYDKQKWHTSVGTISVSGQKFFNWNKHIGGGGAIDLIIHLKNLSFIASVHWLANNITPRAPAKHLQYFQNQAFKSPKRDDRKLSQIVNYLTNRRYIPLPIVKSIIKAGNLYADYKANAVFLLLGKEKIIVGAELRGTTNIPWKGMAPGSRKDLGYFHIKSINSKNIALCESAIDAISFFTLYPNCSTISTAGANPNPIWLQSLVNSGYQIYCAFDADTTGDKLAKKMTTLYPTIKRLRPSKLDWNEVLTAKIEA